MPPLLKFSSLSSLILLSACMPIETIREAPAAVSQPTERVIIREIAKPPEGCGYMLSEYLDFSRLSDDSKREEVSALKSRIKAEQDPCDRLRLALYHSAPGKLRQTDETILELLDSVADNHSHLGSNDHALMALIRNEMQQRSIIQKKVSRHNQRLDEERAENRQLLQRLAELQLQLDQLKDLETNIDPEQ